MIDSGKPLRSRLGDGASKLDPLLDMAKGELERAPLLMLRQLEHLMKASAHSGQAERERLAKRYGEDDPSARARGQQAAIMDILVGQVDRIGAELGAAAEAEPMRIKGQAPAATKAREGLTIEVVEAGQRPWVVARTRTDEKGGFELSLGADAAAFTDKTAEYRVRAEDQNGREVGRSAPFAFKAGKTLTVRLDQDGGAPDPEPRRAPGKAPKA